MDEWIGNKRMNTIWKYTLEITDRQQIEMPKVRRILHVGNQNETICIWVHVDPDAAGTEMVKFEVYGTGHPIKEHEPLRRYLGTVFTEGTQLVWHVFTIG